MVGLDNTTNIARLAKEGKNKKGKKHDIEGVSNTTCNDYQCGDESWQIGDGLKELQAIAEATLGVVQTSLSVKNFQTEVFTQLLKQNEVMICLLEQIAKQTCASLNEANYQTDFQKSLRDSLSTLLELYKTEHPGAVLELERLRELNRRIEVCCPLEEPKPICEPKPCPQEPPTSEGSADSLSASTTPNYVEGAPFPHFDISITEGRNEGPGFIVPAGPLRGSLAPTVRLSPLLKLTSDPDDAEAQGGAGENPVIFDRNSPFGNKVSFSGIPPDMSGAMRDNVVLMTGNTFAALSTDGGANFTALDPTTIFPSAPNRDAAGNLLDNGLCCDQVIQYVPQIDRFIWLMQFCGSGAAAPGGNCLQGINRIRIAAASPNDVVNSKGTVWTYWDITSGDLGIGSTTMDYPDMSVGAGFLYISTDKVGPTALDSKKNPPANPGGLIVIRMPLAEIQNRATVNYNFTNFADSRVAYGGHITQNTGDTVFWAGHNDSTSQMRVFVWPESSGRYSWRDININSWPNTDYSSNCPDGTNWLSFGFPGSGVIGATRRFGGGFFPGPASEVWFAWTAARGGGFAHPHVQVVQIDTTDSDPRNWSVTNQWQIWNPDHAFAYPCLATNTNQEIGISLGWGGNKQFFANHAVGILGDFVVWYAEASDAAISRWGDYVTVRQASPKGTLYAAVGYAVLRNTPPATGTRFNPRYVLFGRASDVTPPPPPPR
jgi:hypothetical protein